MVEAIVLAGSLNDKGLREISGEAYEALIPVAGKPMIEYILAALGDSDSVSRIILVGPRELGELPVSKPVTLVENTITMMGNLRLGLGEAKGEDYVLLASSDIPLLTAEAVEDFLTRAKTLKGDLFYSVVEKGVNEEYYPGVRRTYVKLKDGTFTGGNLFYFHPRIVEDAWSFAEEMVNLRKEPVKMCARLGFFFTLRLLLGHLSVNDLERRVRKLIGIDCRAVISPYPEVGIDIDQPQDHRLVQRILGGKRL